MSVLTRAIRAKMMNRAGVEASTWFKIRAGVDGPTRVMIYDEIGDYGITASDFIYAIAGVHGPIELHINSYGGEVDAGIAIYQALKDRKDPTVCVVDSIAASIASVIAMGCDQVMMARNATMMIHEASGVAVGNADEMHSYADVLAKYSANIADIYVQKAGGTVDEWRALMRAETWMSSGEAVTAGLADGIWGEQTPVALVVPVGQALAPEPPVREPEPVTPAPEPVVPDTAPTDPVDDGFDWDPEQVRKALKEACNA